MKKFIVRKFNLSFGKAIDNLLKLKNEKAFIVLLGNDIGYAFNKNGILTQIDIEVDTFYEDVVVDRDKVQSATWVLYVEADTCSQNIDLNCFDKD